jgi:hypothetical protein
MFNYFLHNNDIFRFISPEDEKNCHLMTLHTANKEANAFFGTLGGVFVVDQVLLRFMAPNFRIPRFRLLVNLTKYALFPCIGFTVVKYNLSLNSDNSTWASSNSSFFRCNKSTNSTLTILTRVIKSLKGLYRSINYKNSSKKDKHLIGQVYHNLRNDVYENCFIYWILVYF